jgi:HAD superfamily hydrolase (TIGR01509 family)
MEIRNRTIDAILFDFIGVLLFPKKVYTPDELVDEIDRYVGQVTNDPQFKKEMMEKFGLSEEQFDKVIGRIVDKYEAFGQLWDLLPELRKHYKLAIINNGTAFTLAKFKLIHPVEKCFDTLVSSAIEGVKKPEAEIFLRAAQRMEVVPQRCLFMDDSLDNVEGARQVGMKAIWWPDQNSGFREFIAFLEKD